MFYSTSSLKMSSLLKNALVLEANGHYAEAIAVYKQLRSKISQTAFELNIELLEKKLSEQKFICTRKYLYLEDSYRQYFGSNHPFLSIDTEELVDFSNESDEPRNDWPERLKLPVVEGLGNDYTPIEIIKNNASLPINNLPGISIVISFFNRPHFLSLILNSIALQSHSSNIEVIISDDGSQNMPVEIINKYENMMNLKYIRRPDLGYTLNAARNAGVRLASNEIILLLDSDIVLPKHFCKEISNWFSSYKNLFILGLRRFVSFTENFELFQNLQYDWESIIKEVKSDNIHMRTSSDKQFSVDWRLDQFKKTDWLKADLYPYKYTAGCMMAFMKKNWEDIGMFDEDFDKWGCEDVEFGYRLF